MRQVRDHAEVEEEEAPREVGRDGHGVPQERGAEVRPELAFARIREDVVEPPVPAQVHQGVEAAHHQGQGGHRLGPPQDGRAPGGPGDPEDRGDERPRVGEADPEDEEDDHHPPHDGAVEAGDAEPGEHHVDEGGDGRKDHEEQRPRPRVPPFRRGEVRPRELVVEFRLVQAGEVVFAFHRPGALIFFRYTVLGSVPRCSINRKRRGSFIIRETALSGSSRSPNRIAPGGQVWAQAGRTSPSRIGLPS